MRLLASRKHHGFPDESAHFLRLRGSKIHNLASRKPVVLRATKRIFCVLGGRNATTRKS